MNERTGRHARRILERADRLTTPITRRSLLGRLSAATLALTLPVWRQRELEAQTTPAIKRLFVFFTPNGTLPDRFWPVAGPELVLSPLLAPLEPFKSQLLVLRGLHMHSTIGDNKPGGPHMKGPGAMLTGGYLLEGSFTGAGGPAGWASHVSVDQELAAQIGTETAYPSLEFGVQISGQEPLRVVSYRGPNQPNQPIDDPWTMFDRVFGNFVPDESARNRLIRDRTAVLDYAKDELVALRQRLPAEDRPRLEAHLSAVENVARKLGALGLECQVPSLGEPEDVRAKENYPRIGELQMDLMFHAQACDLTRVSSFMWSNADSWQYFPWIGVDEEHHALSHLTDGASLEKLFKINYWYSQQIAYFLAKLAATPEGEGSMLDNSLVLWGNEIGEGSSHTHRDIPWVLAGSAAGRLATGRYLEFQDRPHNDLLLSILHAFDLTDRTSFGAPEHCTGPLPGLEI